MKALLNATAWGLVCVAIMYAALRPDGGVMYQSPLSALGLGLIGLGICMEVRQRRLAAAK